MKLRKFTAVALILILALFALSACAPKDAAETKSGISIVSTVFPSYDFARQITAGTDANITLLLQPGEEVHSFDPTSQDIIRIQNADLFLYVGGENDTWVNGVLAGLDKSVNTFRMMDYVTLYEEELVAGMQPESATEAAGETKEWDEHVWTAPVNAIAIVKAMTEELVSIDPANAKTYQANSDAYVAQLEALDQSFRDVVDASARKTVVFADRFPVRYFVEEFDLSYYAAFPGCSAETEASAATIASLIDHVKSENIPVVFYIEMSNQQMADTVAEATGATPMLFHTCHNVTKAEFESGATYLSLMKNNVLALKAALN
ncbi:MAG: metal ABC transporter substrate-binding protein [Christensenella sp.]|nr:metal ABC transporter substrate-binding protein [Christensenella sp.]